MNKMRLVVGDWSDDGHGKSYEKIYEVNKTVLEVQEAYKASCKLTSVSFNHNEDYTGIERGMRDARKYSIATGYDSPSLSEEVIEVLSKFEGFGKHIDKYGENTYIEDFSEMWWWFTKLSIEGLEYKEIVQEIPAINGYWNGNLNVQFGCGLFD
jgi:hypothetical protein